MDQQGSRHTTLLRPIQKTRAYEEIVSQFQTLIEQGRLRPGDRLPTERELAAQFLVSRVTVRQALSVLQAMGFIESRVGDGTFARRSETATVTALASMLSPPPSTLLEQLEVRRLIEPEVARLATSRATEAQIKEFATYVGAQERKMDSGVAFVEEDSALHLAIARSSGNSLLVRMIESIHELLRASREESLRTRAAMARSLAGHVRILEAIGKHDERAARRAMLRHLLEVESLIIDSDRNRFGA